MEKSSEMQEDFIDTYNQEHLAKDFTKIRECPIAKIGEGNDQLVFSTVSPPFTMGINDIFLINTWVMSNAMIDVTGKVVAVTPYEAKEQKIKTTFGGEGTQRKTICLVNNLFNKEVVILKIVMVIGFATSILMPAAKKNNLSMENTWCEVLTRNT